LEITAFTKGKQDPRCEKSGGRVARINILLKKLAGKAGSRSHSPVANPKCRTRDIGSAPARGISPLSGLIRGEGGDL